MGEYRCYAQHLADIMPALRALPAHTVVRPRYDIAHSVQWACDLHAQATLDLRALERFGLQAGAVAGVWRAACGLVHAQRVWVNCMVAPVALREEWAQRRAEALELRCALCAEIRFAYHGQGEAARKMRGMGRRRSHDALVQSVRDLVAITREYSPSAGRSPVAAEMVARAGEVADTLASLLARMRAASTRREALDTRNRAFTWLWQRVQEVCVCGVHAFAADPSRRLKYSTTRFLRRK